MSYNDFINYFPRYTFLKPLFEKKLIPYHVWKKGELICQCNKELNDLYFFTSGRGKAYRPLNNGKDVIYCSYGPGEIAGDVEFIIKTGTSCNIVSTNNLSGYKISKSIIYEDIYKKMLSILSEEVARKFLKSSMMTSIKLGYNLEERVAYYSLYEYKNEVYSMEELAGLLSTTYRHLSRVFKNFSDNGYLKIENRCITILDKKKLEKICEIIKEDFL